MNNTYVGIEDQLAINDLLSRYCHAMDGARADLCVVLFDEHAEIETQVGNAQGRVAIREWIEGRLALRDPAFQVRHFLIQPLLTRLDEDQVRVRSMLLYTRQVIDASSLPELLSTGIYEDVVTRSGSTWRFLSRRFALSDAVDDAYFIV